MKLLLDTHICLWYLQGSDRLSDNLRQIMALPETELWLSPISIWEVLILAEKGRIELSCDPLVWVKKYLRSVDFMEASLTHEIAILSRKIKLSHQDPADRFIVATALNLELILATVDSRLTGLNWLQTIN